MAFSFGTPAAPTATQPAAAGTSGTSTFSFGQTPAQQQQKPATGGFSFGTPASQSATSAAAPATSTGGGLFGGFGNSQPAAATSTQAPASSTGGLFSFGAKPAAATSQPQQTAGSASTFGSSTGGGLFSNTSATTQPSSTGTGFSFGAPATSQQPQQQQSNTTSLFGAPASSFATSSAQQPVAQTQFSAQQQQQPQQSIPAQPDKKLGTSLSAKLEQIRAAWDTNNAAGCRFAYYFYNNAGNSQNLKMIQGRRPDAVGPMHDQLWMAAVRENPDPNRLYPVLALGFNDLKKRIESQAKEAQRQRALLSNLATRLSALEQKHSLSNSVRAQAAQNRQAQLHHKLIGLVAKTQLLIPALRGKSIGPEEERLIAILEACEAEITGSNNALSTRAVASTAYTAGAASDGHSVHPHHPANHARLRAMINELWAQLGVIRAKREMLAREGRSATTEWAVVDQSGLDNVTRILGQQQQGLNHLSTTLENDTKTMETITNGLMGVKLVGVSR
ncbi:related to NUP57 - nuclear pore protein [Ustilago trichophora]|uniref:Related to NUP57 - nuclear pore protein n=1 Tax=Ustilago trichophora TaxID=86804 RepID=A0A5C3E4U9_9BASI|nr:related to NUP57 - nuclear pore protein [Ustilago trichophora]